MLVDFRSSHKISKKKEQILFVDKEKLESTENKGKSHSLAKFKLWQQFESSLGRRRQQEKEDEGVAEEEAIS